MLKGRSECCHAVSHVLGTAPEACFSFGVFRGWTPGPFPSDRRHHAVRSSRLSAASNRTMAGLDIYITNATAPVSKRRSLWNAASAHNGWYYLWWRQGQFVLDCSPNIANPPCHCFVFLACGFPWGLFFLLLSRASSWCDRRFTFHILGGLLLSLQRYYTKKPGMKRALLLRTSIVARMPAQKKKKKREINGHGRSNSVIGENLRIIGPLALRT